MPLMENEKSKNFSKNELKKEQSLKYFIFGEFEWNSRYILFIFVKINKGI